MKDNSNDNKYSTINLLLRITKEYVNPIKYKFIFSIILTTLASACISYKAYLMKPAIDKMFIDKNVSQLYIIPLQLLAISLILCVFNYCHGLIMTKINQNITASLRERLLRIIIKKDISYFQMRTSPLVISYFNDLNGIMDTINLILNTLIKQLITIIALVILMIYQNGILSLLAMSGFSLIIIPTIRITKRIRKLMKTNINGWQMLCRDIGEDVDNIKIIKTNNKEEYEIARKTADIEDLRRLNIKIARKSLLSEPMMEIVSTIGLGFVLIFGGWSVINERMTTGEFFAFIAALLSVYKPARAFSGINIKIQNAILLATRMYKLFDDANEVKEKENPINLQNITGDLEFKDVSFRYKENSQKNVDIVDEEVKLCDKMALTDINLTMKSGYSYALVGHSGSGKSTIFNLINRFYDPISGEVLLDGVNLKDLSFESLYKAISVVDQDVKLFNATILENIKYSRPDATDEEVIEAAKMANAHEFIETMEDGYNSIIGPNGTMLSGGQKQRISIARALLKNAPILLLDEPTSALDPVSENLIQDALQKLMKNKTTIIIAHRLSTIVNCDCIFVLENGKLVEQGNHEELIAKNGIYKGLCEKQFSARTQHIN